MSSSPIPEELQIWALAALGERDCGVKCVGSVVAGDASNRRYFRLQRGSHSDILVDAPPATEKNEAFVAIRLVLEEAGLRVPALRAADLDRGYLVLEDMGDRLLLPELQPETADDYYHRAFELLHKMAAVEEGGLKLPAYDNALFSKELGRFPDWFATALLGCELGDAEKAMLGRAGEVLLRSAAEQPRVLVHRDFHSRNLMLQAGDELAVIDFQDAVVGPLTYDLVSLLRDCYIRWPEPRVREWALAYRELILARGLSAGDSEAQFLRWFDLMGLQRHIKVLGTFARLYLRDGKPGYLEDLPLVIAYVKDVLAAYSQGSPELAELLDWFERRLDPLIAASTWGRGL